jgi:TfoX/Sxy family transcriptional regulator of competence genes
MSSNQETIDYILDQLSPLGNVRARKMFGDYALYCDEKVVGLVCENQLFIKYTVVGKKFAEGKYTPGFAYKGARESMNVTDGIDDRDFITTLVRYTADALPIPKPKKKK